MVLAFALRLGIGMLTPLDADESVEGIAALRILHGHFVLMESNARYLGALDSYILAPFVAVFGPTVLAIRVGLSLVGAAYTGVGYLFGRFLFAPTLPSPKGGGRAGGLLLAAIVAVFPFFALSYGIKARTYGVLLLLEVVLLLLGLRLAWPTRPPRWWEWAGFGLVAGISVWHDVLLVIPLAACVAAFVLRSAAIGWARLSRGAGLAVVAALVGFSPWLLYNAQTRLGSLRHLYAPLSSYSIPTAQAIKQVLSAALPIFVGARVNFCGQSIVPSLVIDVGLGLLAVAVLWIRREALAAVVRGRFSEVAPVDAVLVIAPLALLAVTVHWFNSLSCEPRYLMPLAVPLALALALLVRSALPLRIAGVLALAGCLVMSAIVVQRSAEPLRNLVVVPGAPLAHVDLPAAVAALEREPAQAIWAQYWLARPIEYLSGDQLLVGEYGGYVGFPDTQSAAIAATHSGWLFIAGDPEITVFKAACAGRGITYRETRPVPELVFLADLSRPLTPSDLGINTQTVQQAS